MESNIRNSNVEKDVTIYKDVMIRNSTVRTHSLIADYAVVDNSFLSEHVEIDRNCYIQDSKIGCGTYIRKNSLVKFSTIGKFNCISWNVSIGGSNHNYKSASMYTPYWWERVFEVKINPEVDDSIVTIGNGVWIGAGANIIRGINIGNGAVIGTGAVITKDVEPYSIVVGVPGKPIKKRFDEDVIRVLDIVKWWDWPFNTIRENANLLSMDMNMDVAKKLVKIAKEIEHE